MLNRPPYTLAEASQYGYYWKKYRKDGKMKIGKKLAALVLAAAMGFGAAEYSQPASYFVETVEAACIEAENLTLKVG